jgi:hypothetical protein
MGRRWTRAKARRPEGPKALVVFAVLAEQVGFEPTVRHNRTPDFESGAFDHSATAPDSVSRGAKPKILTDHGASRSTPPM